jgi:hypothetical protein
MCRVFWLVKRKERDHLEDLEVDWRISVNLSERRSVGGMDWIWLYRDRDKWKAPVNAVIKLRAQYSAGNILASLGTASCMKNDSATWSSICNLSILFPHISQRSE